MNVTLQQANHLSVVQFQRLLQPVDQSRVSHEGLEQSLVVPKQLMLHILLIRFMTAPLLQALRKIDKQVTLSDQIQHISFSFLHRKTSYRRRQLIPLDLPTPLSDTLDKLYIVLAFNTINQTVGLVMTAMDNRSPQKLLIFKFEFLLEMFIQNFKTNLSKFASLKKSFVLTPEQTFPRLVISPTKFPTTVLVTHLQSIFLI